MATNKDVKELKAIIRQAAQKQADEIFAELDAFDATRISPIPSKTRVRTPLGHKVWKRDGKGDWDFLERLDPREVNRLKRKWVSTSASAATGAPDVLASQTRYGSDQLFASSSSEAGAKFARMTAQIDALEFFAKTGRIPSHRSHGSAGNFYDLLESALGASDKFDQTLIEQGFDVQEFLIKGNASEARAYLKGVREQLTDEELHYMEMEKLEAAKRETAKAEAQAKQQQAQENARRLREEAEAKRTAAKQSTESVTPMTPEQRRQAAIDRANERTKNKQAATKSSPKKPVVKSSPKKPVVSGQGTPEEIGDLFDDVSESFDSVINEVDDSYITSFEDIPDVPGAYGDDLIDVADDAGDVLSVAFDDLSTVRPTGPDKLASLGTVVDDLTSGPGKPKRMFPGLTAKVQSVLEQTVDLAVDISNDISKGSSTTGARVTGVTNAVKKSSTVKEIIKNLDQAKSVVSGLSNKQKTGYTLGALGTIGLLSSNKRNERRR